MDANLGIPLSFLLVILLGIVCVGVRIYLAKKQAFDAERRRHLVLARVKEKQDGVWFCKFFFCGDHIGFFRNRPSADRVKAVIVGYDERKECFELEEISADK